MFLEISIYAIILVSILSMWILLFTISIRSYLKIPKLKSTKNRLEKTSFNIYGSKSTLSKLLKSPTISIDYHFNPFHTKDIASLPFVSVIVPARNEKEGIERCLLTILKQDYPFFEIIAVDDCSSDATFELMKKVKDQNQQLGDRLTILSPQDYESKPNDWFGKPWVSENAFKKSTGEIILFTDADTNYINTYAIYAAISYMQQEKLDVLGGLPYIKLQDLFSRIVMPLWNLLSLLFSNAGMVNDPNRTNMAYLLGSFFLIKREVFLKSGTYKIVKDAIQEDYDLALVLKRNGFKIRLVKIDSLVTALWSRDHLTLWHGIGRTIVPIAIRDMKKILFGLFSIFYMAALPFIICFYFIFRSTESPTSIPNYLLELAILSCCIVICSTYVKGLIQYKEKRPWYAFLSFVGALYLIIAYLDNLLPLILKGYKTVIWKERNYKYNR